METVDWISILVGIVCGILAGIPAVILVLFAVARRERRKLLQQQQERDRAPYWIVVELDTGPLIDKNEKLLKGGNGHE